jgi:hypothetical protein
MEIRLKFTLFVLRMTNFVNKGPRKAGTLRIIQSRV